MNKKMLSMFALSAMLMLQPMQAMAQGVSGAGSDNDPAQGLSKEERISGGYTSDRFYMKDGKKIYVDYFYNDVADREWVRKDSDKVEHASEYLDMNIRLGADAKNNAAFDGHWRDANKTQLKSSFKMNVGEVNASTGRKFIRAFEDGDVSYSQPPDFDYDVDEVFADAVYDPTLDSYVSTNQYVKKNIKSIDWGLNATEQNDYRANREKALNYVNNEINSMRQSGSYHWKTMDEYRGYKTMLENNEDGSMVSEKFYNTSFRFLKYKVAREARKMSEANQGSGNLCGCDI